MSAPDDRERRARWALVLGEGSEESLGGSLSDEERARDKALEFLYGREGRGRNVRGGRSGSLDDSVLAVPAWINDVHDLFPVKTIERLEKDALERYKIEELVTNPELLRRAVPSQALLKAVLRTKHLMNQEVLALARDLVKKAVADLMEKLARPVGNPFFGSRDRQRRSYLRIAKNFDIAGTVRRNLRNFDPEGGRIVISEPLFHSRQRSLADRWRLILLVDESGSMAGSVIHAAVTAAIFWGIRSIDTRLAIFDTNVVDLTADCTDPVETLMKVQLGGGTDIHRALAYAEGLVETPRKTIIVLITDFFEGGSEGDLLATAKRLVEGGVTLLGLAALDEAAKPSYDKELAQRLVNLGAEVGAMTPGELAAWVGEKVK